MAGCQRQSSSIRVDGRSATTQILILKVAAIGNDPRVTIQGRIEPATGIATKDVWVVLSRVVRVERQVSRLGTSGDFTFRGDFAGYDEIKAMIGQQTLSCANLTIAHDATVTLRAGQGRHQASHTPR